MCKCSFYVKYGTGKSGCMFTENLYKASNRDCSRGELLASMCENIGVIFMKSPSLSERVCHPCSRRIRNLCKLFDGIKNATSHDKAEVGATTECRATFLGLSLKWLCGSSVDFRVYRTKKVYILVARRLGGSPVDLEFISTCLI